MSEDTSLTKAGNAVSKHGNKVYNGLSAGAIIWLFATFPSKDLLNDHVRQSDKVHDECSQKRSKQWQRIADLELELERVRIRTGRVTPHLPGTNETVSVGP